LAFLLPVVERLLEADPELYRRGRNIGILVLVPTRELAIQIAEQATALLTFHKDMDVACIYGGTKMQKDTRLFSKGMPTILVATPGRLLDHLEETRIERRKFSDILSETRIVVLDETDRLLGGFSKETNRILSYLPRVEKRQTLLFSATLPKKVRSWKDTMKIDCTEVDCVNDEDVRTEDNRRVEQSYIVLHDMEQYIPTLVTIILKTMEEDPDTHKVMVFFPASNLVRFFVNLFTDGLEIPVFELHSRLSQAARNRASSDFRSAKRGILFTTDVSARGLDYPDVSLVVQYGAPSTIDGYIHRLGRTGRAGRAGRGVLVLLPFEEQCISSLCRGVQLDVDVALSLEEDSAREKIGKLLEPVRRRIRSRQAALSPGAEAAYLAFLAYYIADSNGLEPAQVLEFAKTFAYSSGMAALPSLESKLASRLGLVDKS
jgi:ATP-dependent RNA helicase MSS116